MKRHLIIFLLAVAITSCKKDEPTTIPTTPTNPTTQNYSLQILAMDDVPGYNMPAGMNWYKNFKVVINGDTLSELLVNHTVQGNLSSIFDDYQNGIALPTNGLSYEIEVGTNYNIQIIDATSHVKYYERTGTFAINSNDDELYLNTQSYSIFDSNFDASFSQWDSASDVEARGIASTHKAFMVVGTTVAP